MQYGIDILPYKRMKKQTVNQTNKKGELLKSAKIYLFYGVLTLLISRVKLLNGMAPFGISLVICLSFYLNREELLSVVIGGILGYVSLVNSVEMAGQYILCLVGLLILNFIIPKEDRRVKFISMLCVTLIEFSIVKVVFTESTLGMSVFYSFMEVMIVTPLYYIINKGIICFKEIDNKRLFDNEEIISMGIIISLVLSGTWGISIKNISFMNFIGLYFVAIVGFVCGSSIGAGIGVSLGIVMGMSSTNMAIYISVFSACGIISGIFRDTGKYFTSLAFGVTFFIVQMYLGGVSVFLGVELVIAMGLFLVTPNKIFEIMDLDFNLESKKEDLKENYVDKVRTIYEGRMKNFSQLLFNISDTLNSLVDNEKLELKGKSSALVENLADRVCGNCTMKTTCWKREMHYTYSSFAELIQNYQENKFEIPFELENKCINRTVLMKNTEDIVNKYIINEMKRNSLCEGREMLSQQINNMAYTVSNISEEISNRVHINIALESKIKRLLDKSRIPYIGVICVNENNRRTTAKLVVKDSMLGLCKKEILNCVGEAFNSPITISKEGCIIDKDKGICTVTYEEIPKYHIDTYVAVKCKDGEKCNGDSYRFEKLKDGTYLSIISDGMGSGPQAKIESEASVELINQFCKSGFSKSTAISTINSIMGIKFSETEKFSTLDLCSVDMYTGDINFMKVGAVDSFIKRSKDVQVVKCNSLPFGILDKVDVETEEFKGENGDLVIMVSDGVIDYNDKENLNSNWMEQYIKEVQSNTPKDVAMDILNEVLCRKDYKVKDDMTILVSKIYAVY